MLTVNRFLDRHSQQRLRFPGIPLWPLAYGKEKDAFGLSSAPADATA